MDHPKMCCPEHNNMNELGSIVASREELQRHIARVMDATKQVQDGCPFEGISLPNSQTILRRLSAKERSTLKDVCRCTSKDWSTVYLILSKSNQRLDQSENLQTLVSDNQFDGMIVFDLTGSEQEESFQSSSLGDWLRLSPGVHSNVMVADSIFRLHSCRVYRNNMLCRTYVGTNAVLINCSYVSATNDALYGKLSITVGPESGGERPLELSSEHVMIDVCNQLRDGPITPNQSSSKSSNNTSKPFAMNVLGDSCIVRDTPTVENVYLHKNSSIEAAASVKMATLFPESRIFNNCTVSSVLLQWNSTISDHSTVSDTFLMEQAHCGPNSIVASTVLGPDVHVSAGEVHASIIGPNTNAHHQSLVISVLWPMGRGNVGYGANVGSNHTGRLPDQETTAGEGVFWGLSTVVKFPVDMTFSPYSIVAAGTTLPPQRVCMPFSLLVEQLGGNEIIPGWVLQSSPYTLVRSEKKYANRRKAKRHHYYTGWKVFRPETIEMCRWAKAALATDDVKNVPGLGANKLTVIGQDVGIRAYTDIIHRYALHGLLSWILRLTNGGKGPLDLSTIQDELTREGDYTLSPFDADLKVEWPTFPWDVQGPSEWEYQKSLLLESFPIKSSLAEWLEMVLKKLKSVEKDFARRIHKGKHRDDVRGARTIPGYAHAHVSAEKDPVIVEAQDNAEKVNSAVSDILDLLSAVSKSRL